ncbi:hypothetical protein DFH08DRAFT_808250 [Mycena albidolilacea]|uniref:Uncharacterized protein n=1 Tax=Mycena albidolilacea TaxID=1033008 RepID=A0AAD7A307_9AGAR|nr:hypothetical protein DFH08DRAFT_808250 [Mycena albidolilacea]
MLSVEGGTVRRLGRRRSHVASRARIHRRRSRIRGWYGVGRGRGGAIVARWSAGSDVMTGVAGNSRKADQYWPALMSGTSRMIRSHRLGTSLQQNCIRWKSDQAGEGLSLAFAHIIGHIMGHTIEKKLYTTPQRRDIWERTQAQRESKEEGKRGADVACTAADQIHDRAGLRDASVNGRGEAPMGHEEREAVLERGSRWYPRAERRVNEEAGSWFLGLANNLRLGLEGAVAVAAGLEMRLASEKIKGAGEREGEREGMVVVKSKWRHGSNDQQDGNACTDHARADGRTWCFRVVFATHLLYYFIQFGGHGSQAPKSTNIFVQRRHYWTAHPDNSSLRLDSFETILIHVIRVPPKISISHAGAVLVLVLPLWSCFSIGKDLNCNLRIEVLRVTRRNKPNNGCTGLGFLPEMKLELTNVLESGGPLMVADGKRGSHKPEMRQFPDDLHGERRWWLCATFDGGGDRGGGEQRERRRGAATRSAL